MMQVTANFPINISKEDAIEFLTSDLPLTSGSGKTTPQNRLKKLGALRLLAAADNWAQARVHANEHKTENGIAPLYPNQEKWCKARTGAKEEIQTALDRLL